PRYQGAGSSMVNATNVETIKEMFAHDWLQLVGAARGYERTGGENETLLKEAVDLAKKADVVLYFFGLDELSESEGLDRVHMKLPKNQIRLLEQLAEANPKVVGILSAGAAVEMSWDGRCQAILHSYLSGQAGAGAMMDLLTGKRTPCGKLNETYPISYEETPAFHYFPGKERNSEYREGIYIGYRYYGTAGVSVKYPFGYGLSYTTFAYSDLKVAETGITFTLENTGDFDGAEVAQMYVALPESEIFRPAKELKGFRKVFLKAGEKTTVTIPFDDKTFRYWNVVTGKWEVEEGAYQITVGGSSEKAELWSTISVKGSGAPKPYDRDWMKSYFSGKIRQVPDEEFELLLGHEIPNGSWGGLLTENDAICQLSYAKSSLGRLVYRILTRKKEKSEAKGKPDLNILFIYNMPFRGIAKMTNGAVSMEMVDGMVQAANGQLFSGAVKVIRGYFRNRRENRMYEKLLYGREEAK
ncbi:MAG: glycoside hydrolase family 3 C-terminal domain-containing protein, partial [Lachnospiraceae bacterium]|nr:glycoside hydrolase family 3 C-terminal domain-containing protein [Lachnospiraceae bacterium]